MKEVFITRVAKYLPNNPVSIDEMETYLGFINGKPSRAKKIVLRNNGIKTRYYALSKEGNITHNNAQLAAEAVRSLFDSSFNQDDIELLACGTSYPDQIMPSHAIMVHGYLGGRPMETFSPMGNCCSGMHALKIGFMSIQAENTSNAVIVGSELCSPMLQAKNYEEEAKKIGEMEENPILAFEKDFLRWMLSDGSGAFLLEDKPAEKGLSLKIEWIDSISFANEVETCMYAASDKDENGNLISFKQMDPKVIAENSVMAMKQDVKLLDQHISLLAAKALKGICKKRNFDVKEIKYVLPHLSSEFFRFKIAEELIKYNLEIPQEKWFTNLTSVGNIGAASVFVMVEEILSSGKLNIGDKLLLAVPESARFSYSYALLTVC
ncbi:MAG: beta-ketoacyl-ACP synthase III [Sporocytophaga sp.]|uniref:beta-ketoacyl-ACP synthase III n=1 Tax=Sporocytophaga sp. TaxID=2231183 RepID=UPI001B09842F|nr:beta-ketoacyl-ACP synthase III [Sporocytophaga sp.]MBO9700279.1 beta-ketoacyl-ACP synthase III [Sporocytophaga sp.]